MRTALVRTVPRRLGVISAINDVTPSVEDEQLHPLHILTDHFQHVIHPVVVGRKGIGYVDFIRIKRQVQGGDGQHDVIEVNDEVNHNILDDLNIVLQLIRKELRRERQGAKFEPQMANQPGTPLPRPRASSLDLQARQDEVGSMSITLKIPMLSEVLSDSMLGPSDAVTQ